jgi:2-polyprenyl-3-methyl-5-hydroxy-6-metoxy-1,4-benzoquinol methylase
VPEAAALARAHYDEVIEGSVEEVLDALSGRFNTVLCLDVLEHLVDPSAVLISLHALAARGGQLQVSAPNARHLSLIYDLVVRGTFGYTDWGHRNRTHLRWFTRGDLVRLIQDAGWQVTGTSHPQLRRSKRLDRLTRGHSTEFLVGQWYVSARRP